MINILKYLVLGSFLLLLFSCERASENQNQISRVSLTLPYAEPESIHKVNLDYFKNNIRMLSTHGWAYLAPSTMTDIKCFAVAVEAPEVATQETCTGVDGTVQMHPVHLIGPVAAGNDINFEIPSGKQRKISLIGFGAADVLACVPFVGSGGKSGPDKTLLSVPVVIGATTTDLEPGENTINIGASVTSATQLSQCSPWPSSGSSPLPVPSLSLSDVTLASGTVISGEGVSATLTLRDASGANITVGGYDVSFFKGSGSSSGTFDSVTDNGDGTFSTVFNGTIAGSSTYVAATIGASNITSTSATIIVLPGSATHANSTLTTAQGMAATFAAGTSLDVTLTFKDMYNNLTTSGGLSVSLAQVGSGTSTASAALPVHGLNSTTWSIEGIVAGTAKNLSGIMNAVSLLSAKPNFTVTAGALSADNSLVSVNPTTIDVFAKSNLSLIPRDHYGNAIKNSSISVSFSTTGSATISASSTPYSAATGAHNKTLTGMIPETVIVSSSVSGTVTSSAIAVNITSITLVVNAAYPAVGGNWNDYIKYSDGNKSWYNQTGEACDGSETGYYGELNGCIHGGEVRKVIIPNATSCDGIKITDASNWFDWGCILDSGNVYFVTRYIKSGKGLRDLISTSGTWNMNNVSLSTASQTLGASTSSTWWSNTISGLTANTVSMTELSTSGTIYYIPASGTSFNTKGIKFANDNMALVTLGAVELESGAIPNFSTSDCSPGFDPGNRIICVGGATQKLFNWIEVRIDGLSAYSLDAGIHIANGKFNRIHNSNISRFYNQAANNKSAIELNSSSSQNYISQLTAFDVAREGALKIEGNKNIVTDAAMGYIASGTVNVMTTINGNGNRLIDSRISTVIGAAGTYGLLIQNASNTVLNNLNVSNVGSLGVLANSAVKISNSEGTIITGLTTANTSGNGIVLFGTPGITSGTIIMNTTSTNHEQNSLYTFGGIYETRITNFLSMNTAKAISTDTSGTGVNNKIENMVAIKNTANTAVSVVLGASYTIGGYLNTNGDGITSGSALVVTANILSSDDTLSVVGKSGDSSNVSGGIAGQETFNNISTGNVLDFLKFSSLDRNWGIDYAGSGFTLNDQGACIPSTNCQIWDWRVMASSNLHNRSASGTQAPNSPFTAGSNCPNEVYGNVVVTPNVGAKFLKYAIEITRDTIGNNNGLCESGEACIYSPNIGAFQGYGNIPPTEKCNFVDGADGYVQGVIMYRYPNDALPPP